MMSYQQSRVLGAVRRGAILVFAPMLLSACGTLAVPVPTPVHITSAESSATMKIRAIQHSWMFVDEERIDHDQMREMLKRVAWKRSQFWEVRTEAVTALLADEAKLSDTRAMLGLMLPTETHWNMIGFICETAGERGWTDLTPAIVRSWSRPVIEPTDDQRPERFALEQLYPERKVEDVVFDVFAGRLNRSGKPWRDRDRKDAWELLLRLDTDGAHTAELLKTESDGSTNQGDSMFDDLRAAAVDLGITPWTREQLEWVQRLREPDRQQAWDETSSIIARLGEEQAKGIGLRHLAGLRWVSSHRPAWFRLARAEVVQRVMDHQTKVRLHAREGHIGMIGSAGESIRRVRDTIIWGDGMMAMIAIEAIGEPEFVRSMFAQADADKRDGSSEHGGLVRVRSSGFKVKDYAPRPSQRRGDRLFIASVEMIKASVDALFHYHFHANRYTNAAFAGPSAGDLDYADRFGAACLVLTYINRDTLDVDLYLPGRTTLDLGVLDRPDP